MHVLFHSYFHYLNCKFAVCASKDVYRTINCCLIINCIDITENYKNTYQMLFSIFYLKPHLQLCLK